MKAWAIERTEFWDDRYDQQKGPASVLPGKAWLSRRACQWHADGWSVASDHNCYKAVRIGGVAWRDVVVIDRYWIASIPRAVSFHLRNRWDWMLYRLPQPVHDLMFWWKYCRRKP